MAGEPNDRFLVARQCPMNHSLADSKVMLELTQQAHYARARRGPCPFSFLRILR